MAKLDNKPKRCRVWLLLTVDELKQIALQMMVNNVTKEELLSAYVREGLSRVQRLGVIALGTR